MKWLLFLLFLIPTIIFAGQGMGPGPGMFVSVGGDTCIAGTYLSVWDGLHASGDDYICDNSTGTQGTQSGGTLSTTYTITANDQYVKWPVSSRDLFNENLGTIWIRLQVAAWPSAAAAVAGSRVDANNGFSVSIQTNGQIYGNFEISGTTQIASTSSVSPSAIPTGEDVWVGYTWDATTTGDHAAAINASGWDVDSAELATSSWTSPPDDLWIGEDDAELGQSHSDTVVIKEIQVFGTYQASHL